MLNNYFKNPSIWNTLSTKKLVLSSYHEKELGYWARISSALVLFVHEPRLQSYILAQGVKGPGKIFKKIGKFGLRAGQKKAGQMRASKGINSR